MRVGIVGAGLAGLAAGRTLRAAGHEVVIYEKSPGFGGRLATRRAQGFVFDTGASNFTPRSSKLAEAMLHELPTEDLVRILRPIWFHENFRASRGSTLANKDDRYIYRQGATQLAKLLAVGLDVQLNQRVEQVELADKQVRMHGQVFDAAVVAVPLPQAEMLLHSAGLHRSVEGTRYRSCLSVLLGFDVATPDVPYFSLLDVEQTTPLTWLSIENMKSPDRAPEGHTAIVAQMSAAYSSMHFQSEDAEIIRDTLIFTRKLLGPQFATPTVSQVKRWKFSQPELTTPFLKVNPPSSRIVLASDALIGGRVEMAYDCGLLAAQHVMNL